MKKLIKNSLPKKVGTRVALIYRLSKIKPEVAFFRFRRLAYIFAKFSLISLIIIMMLGYYPIFSLYHRGGQVLAQETGIQKQEIKAEKFSQPVVLPHPGYLSTPYSKYHPGIDIAAGLGMPVHPITNGVVEEVNYGFFGYGNHVTLAHEEGIKSLYGHLSRIYVKKGQEVTSNNILGEVGITGRTSGPHTHLEITKDGQFIDPITILPEVPTYPTNSSKVQEGASLIQLNLHKTLKPDF